MPSSIGHAAAAVLLEPLLPPGSRLRRVVVVAAGAVALLDLDAVGRPFGMGDLALLGGHRALTHSVPFALVLAVALTLSLMRGTPVLAGRRVYLYLTAVLVSHGALDAMSTYGAGIAFAAPFSWARWKLVWRPLSGILPEVLLLWIPAGILLWHRRASNRAPAATRGNEA